VKKLFWEVKKILEEKRAVKREVANKNIEKSK